MAPPPPTAAATDQPLPAAVTNFDQASTVALWLQVCADWVSLSYYLLAFAGCKWPQEHVRVAVQVHINPTSVHCYSRDSKLLFTR